MDDPHDSNVSGNPSLPKPGAETQSAGKKYALVIGSTTYTDPGLRKLTAPGNDAGDLARVLKDPRLCGFDDVKALIDELSYPVIEAVDEFFDEKKPDDMLVLYFSGHGIRDEFGSLYLAFRNTMRARLRSTAIKADYIREAMDQSRSKRQILILDCCNSGAFPQGTKAEVGGSMGMVNALQGFGRYVLTASDATQFAWEGDRVLGTARNSLFTHFLVKGLEGEADQDGDGRITVDDLYDYAFAEISRVIPNQTPTKSASKQAGDITLRLISRMEDIKPRALPDDLEQALADPRTFVREGAVEQLADLLQGKNLGRARSAKEALEKMMAEDDSIRVRQKAARALGALGQAAAEAVEREPEVQRTEAPSTPVVIQKVKKEPIVRGSAELKTAPFMQVSMEAMRRLPIQRLILGGIGLLAVVFGIVFAASRPLSPRPSATGVPVTGATNPAQTATLLPVTVGLESAATLPPTLIAVTADLLQPVETALSADTTTYDIDSHESGPLKRIPYNEQYAINRLERPFLQDMTYVPNLDITDFNLSQDENWNYVSMRLAGDDPNDPVGIDYGVEIDTNDDGYGEYLIWAHPPYTDQWGTGNVQIFSDSNQDTAAWQGGPATAAASNGYDTLIFDGAAHVGSDPSLAWVRMQKGLHAAIQFAFKRSGIASSFVWGVIADAGLQNVNKLDYVNSFTEADAGSPYNKSEYYPLKALYGVDNTCWLSNGVHTTSSDLKVCPAPKQVTTGKHTGPDCSQNAANICKASGGNWDAASCKCIGP